METKAYLYDDTLLKAINALTDDDWEAEGAQETIRILLNAGFVIRERDPRDEDKRPNLISNPRLGFSTGYVHGSPIYGQGADGYLKPVMDVNATIQINEPQDPRPERAPKAFTEGVR